MIMERVMSSREAAEMIGVTEGTLMNWRSAGKGPVFVKYGRRVVYRPKDVERWLDARTINPEAGAHDEMK